MLVWIWFLVAIVILIYYLRRVYSTFARMNVNFLPPAPFLGNMWRLATRIDHFSDVITKLYSSFPNDRLVGHYEFMNPVIMIRDLELIKQITIKDFDGFIDHRVLINEDNDPFFGKNLFSLKGQKWRDMRSTMSPAFTSSKIRVMIPFMTEVGDQMIAYLRNKIKEQGDGSLDVDMKDLAGKYANDVIASCAFGLKVDSITDEDNEFFKMGKVASSFTFIQMIKFFGFANFPWIMNTLKVKLFTEESSNFFKSIVNGAMKEREEKNIIRPDMIHLLMEAKKGRLTHDQIVDEDAGFATVEESSLGKTKIKRVWSDNDLIAQSVVFFLAGFDIVSSLMVFVLYELAFNKECQDKLAHEIKETHERNNGFDYTSIQEMKYLDMVVSEILRKWSPGIALDRIAAKPYNLGKANKNSTEDYIIQKGEGLWIPVWAIHRDPEYYENPEKFDPERFSDENKHKIKAFTYLPFGSGPRNCIGSRFALCEMKVMVYQLLQHMEVSPSKKTPIPLTLCTETFNLRIKGGHWLKVSLREN